MAAPSLPTLLARAALSISICASPLGCSAADEAESAPPSTGAEEQVGAAGLPLPLRLPLHRALPPESPGVLHLRVDELLASPLGRAALEAYERAAETDPSGGSGLFPILRATEEMVMTLLPSRGGPDPDALVLCRGSYPPATVARFMRLGEIQLSEPRPGLLRGMASEMGGEIIRDVEVAIVERRHFVMARPGRVEGLLHRLERGEGAGPSLDGFDALAERVELGEADASAVVVLTAQARSMFAAEHGGGGAVHLRGLALRLDVEDGLRVVVLLEPDPGSSDVVRQSAEGAIEATRELEEVDRLGLAPLFRSLELTRDGRLFRIEGRLTAAELDRAILALLAATAPDAGVGSPATGAAPSP